MSIMLAGGLARTIRPTDSSRSKRMLFIGSFLLLSDDRQQEVRWPLRIVIELMGHGFAAADVIGDIFDIGHRPGAGGNIHRGDLDTDAMSGLELVGGRQDLDLIFHDLAGCYR